MVVDKIGQFDVIIDDGGHFMHQQQISFGFLFPWVKPGGLYVIEDLQTSLIHKFNPTATENTTLHMLQKFSKSGKLRSDFLNESERQYLESNIQSCVLETPRIGFIRKK